LKNIGKISSSDTIDHVSQSRFGPGICSLFAWVDHGLKRMCLPIVELMGYLKTVDGTIYPFFPRNLEIMMVHPTRAGTI
jgi:hypothetical protein